jgi:hypothetical protein
MSQTKQENLNIPSKDEDNMDIEEEEKADYEDSLEKEKQVMEKIDSLFERKDKPSSSCTEYTAGGVGGGGNEVLNLRWKKRII